MSVYFAVRLHRLLRLSSDVSLLRCMASPPSPSVIRCQSTSLCGSTAFSVCHQMSVYFAVRLHRLLRLSSDVSLLRCMASPPSPTVIRCQSTSLCGFTAFSDCHQMSVYFGVRLQRLLRLSSDVSLLRCAASPPSPTVIRCQSTSVCGFTAFSDCHQMSVYFGVRLHRLLRLSS